MKAFKVILVGLAMFMLWACSQTVSSPDKDSRSDDDLSNIPGYHATGSSGSAKGSSANVISKSSSSTGGGVSSSSEIYPDDNGGDNGGSNVELSNLDVTQYMPDEKLDCDFTVDDDEWQIDYQNADTTVNALIEFKSDGYMWATISEEMKMQDSDECEENLLMFEFIAMLMDSAAQEQGRDDIKASAKCDGALLIADFAGRTEEKVTAADKQQAYDKICK